jgi:hypothetical protein
LDILIVFERLKSILAAKRFDSARVLILVKTKGSAASLNLAFAERINPITSNSEA